MYIKKISLCQNESCIYSKLPRSLASDYKPCYDFKYPFSNMIALDCERIVYKINEHDIQSNICRNLNVVLINESTFESPELTDFIAFNQKDMRFVNVYMNSDKFNELSNEQKRKVLINKICEALAIVSDNRSRKIIEQICDEVYLMSDDTECVFRNKSMTKYTIEVKFKSSLKGYTAILYLMNVINQTKSRTVLFENSSFADLVYRVHKIILKDKKCIIRPKRSEMNEDEPIIIDINI